MTTSKFNWLGYWNRQIATPDWVSRIEDLVDENENLDYFSLKVDGVERGILIPDNYEKHTVLGFKFDEDFEEYYGI